MPRHRLLAPRLRVLITCFPGSLWKDERHQERMEYAKARLGYYRRRDNPAFYAALFLLTSSAELWKRTANCFTGRASSLPIRCWAVSLPMTTRFSLRQKGYTMARAALWRWTLQTRILWTRRRFA